MEVLRGMLGLFVVLYYVVFYSIFGKGGERYGFVCFFNLAVGGS